MSLSLLPPELHGIILEYLCPTEDLDVLLVLNTKFKNLIEWTKSLEITTRQFIVSCWYNVTRVNGKYHRCDERLRAATADSHSNLTMEINNGA